MQVCDVIRIRAVLISARQAAEGQHNLYAMQWLRARKWSPVAGCD